MTLVILYTIAHLADVAHTIAALESNSVVVGQQVAIVQDGDAWQTHQQVVYIAMVLGATSHLVEWHKLPSTPPPSVECRVASIRHSIWIHARWVCARNCDDLPEMGAQRVQENSVVVCDTRRCWRLRPDYGQVH